MQHLFKIEVEEEVILLQSAEPDGSAEGKGSKLYSPGSGGISAQPLQHIPINMALSHIHSICRAVYIHIYIFVQHERAEYIWQRDKERVLHTKQSGRKKVRNCTASSSLCPIISADIWVYLDRHLTCFGGSRIYPVEIVKSILFHGNLFDFHFGVFSLV